MEQEGNVVRQPATDLKALENWQYLFLAPLFKGLADGAFVWDALFLSNHWTRLLFKSGSPSEFGDVA